MRETHCEGRRSCRGQRGRDRLRCASAVQFAHPCPSDELTARRCRSGPLSAEAQCGGGQGRLSKSRSCEGSVIRQSEAASPRVPKAPGPGPRLPPRLDCTVPWRPPANPGHVVWKLCPKQRSGHGSGMHAAACHEMVGTRVASIALMPSARVSGHLSTDRAVAPCFALMSWVEQC